jgi:hypothetical protein
VPACFDARKLNWLIRLLPEDWAALGTWLLSGNVLALRDPRTAEESSDFWGL